jgi:hypothetical protein
MEEEPAPRESEIVIPIKMDSHTYMRFSAFCRQVGAEPAECASKLFRDLISDDEFETAPSQAFH